LVVAAFIGGTPTLLPGTHALVRPGIQGVAIKTSS
jgi:hypothetical protein